VTVKFKNFQVRNLPPGHYANLLVTYILSRPNGNPRPGHLSWQYSLPTLLDRVPADSDEAEAAGEKNQWKFFYTIVRPKIHKLEQLKSWISMAKWELTYYKDY
jgi:hypothetical protein